MKKLILYFIILTFMVSCKYIEILVPINEVILDFKSSATTVPADGENFAVITAELPIETDTSLIYVKFKTDFGKFIPEGKDEVIRPALLQKISDTNKRLATVKIKNDNLSTGKANVTAEIVGYRTEPLQVSFVNAYPEKIKLTTERIYITPNFSESINLVATLARNKGIPTKDNIVELQIRDTLNRNIGYFKNYDNRSGIDGKSTFNYTLGNSTYYGKLFVKAITNDGDKNIADSLIIFSLKAN